MAAAILIGEYSRALDARYRLSLPTEFTAALAAGDGALVLAKERPGCLSLWPAAVWRPRHEAVLEVLRSKLDAGLLARRTAFVQELGRLLSTRHREIRLAGRDRLVLPEGFREFLAVAPGGDVLIVGAAVCVELWQPSAWGAFIAEAMPGFSTRLDELAG
jgi:MraZ protein